MAPSLNTVPNEIVLLVASAICDNLAFEDKQICQFLASLAGVSRRFYDLVNPVLYSFDAKSIQSLAVPWAIKNGNIKVLKMSVDSGVDLLTPISACRPFFRTSPKSHKLQVDDEGRPITDDSPSKKYVELDRWRELTRSHPQSLFDYDSELWRDDESYLDDDECHSTTSRESFLGAWEATPLHLACFWGYRDIVQFLLENEVDLNAPSRGVCSCMEVLNDGAEIIQDDFPAWTPLHTAICSSSSCDMGIAEMLLEAGADVETEALLKETALHTAALQGRTHFIDFLMRGGYQRDVNIKDGRGCTPLHYAYTRSNFCRTIPLLLEYGANIDAHLLGHSALADACETSKYSDALTLLDLGADISSAFSESAEHGLLHSCFPRIPVAGAHSSAETKIEQDVLLDRILAQGKVDPNQRDSRGSTPLMWAAKAHSTSGVKKLLEAGARVDIHNEDGVNALIFACTPPSFFTSSFTKLEPMDSAEKWEMEAIEITKTLLEHGCTLDHRDSRGRTAFHTLCERGSYLTNLLVRYFMNQGADSTSRDKRGDSIFKSALLKGALEICDILLRHPGGVKTVPPKDTESILASLLSSWERPKWDKQFEYVLDLLISPNTEVEDIFKSVVAAKKWGAISIMVKRGLVPPADRVQVNPFCDLPPCRVDRSSRELVMKSLVKLGYDVNARNSQDETPLCSAVGSDDFHLVDQLLKLGADVHAGPSSGRPLNSAIKNARGDIVELLLKYASLKPLPLSSRISKVSPGLCFNDKKNGKGKEKEPAANPIPQTYLHFALRKDNWLRGQPPPLRDPIYHMLLDAGADPNYRDPDSGGDTPLHVFLRWVKDLPDAARDSKEPADRIRAVLRKFISKHVDINVRNSHGVSAADLLREFLQSNRFVAVYLRRTIELVEGAGRPRLRIEESGPSAGAGVGSLFSGTGRVGSSVDGNGFEGARPNGWGLGGASILADMDDEDDGLMGDIGCPCGHYPFG